MSNRTQHKPHPQHSMNRKNHRQQQQHQTPNTTRQNVPGTVPHGFLPAFLPGSSSLVEQIDRKLLIVLRDGRHLIGVLRSFDQFSNFLLEDSSERRILDLGNGSFVYTDIQLGLFLVRGDSMVLLGEVEDDNEENQEDIIMDSTNNAKNNNDKNNKDADDTTKNNNIIENATTPVDLSTQLKQNLNITENNIERRSSKMRKVTLQEFDALEKEAKEKNNVAASKQKSQWNFDGGFK